MAVESKTRFQKSLLGSSRGVAVVEMLPLLLVFVMLFGLTFGFWGAIHRATLHSIAARHLAFEVIHNRSDLSYHRDTQSQEDADYYNHKNVRYFAIVKHYPANKPPLEARKSPLSLFNKGKIKIDTISIPQNQNQSQSQSQSQDPKVSPIRLEIGYGICISSHCQ